MPSAEVLLIAADPIQRDLIVLALRRLGLSPLYTPDGAEAMRLFPSLRPRLVILDTYLPNQNGLDLLKQFQAAGWLTHTDVIVISAYAFPEVVRQAHQSGAREFLLKPLDTDLLVQRVAQILAERK